jgi:hypothetical protein
MPRRGIINSTEREKLHVSATYEPRSVIHGRTPADGTRHKISGRMVSSTMFSAPPPSSFSGAAFVAAPPGAVVLVDERKQGPLSTAAPHRCPHRPGARDPLSIALSMQPPKDQPLKF